MHTTSNVRLGRGWVLRLVASGLVILGLLAAPAGPAAAEQPSPEQFRAMGSTHAADYRLRPGCHTLRFSYRISPPEPEWALEVFIVDAAGTGQATDISASGADPTSATHSFQLCTDAIAPGRFTIRARLTYHHYASMPLLDHDADYTGWLASSTFAVTTLRTHRAATTRKCRQATRKAHRLGTRKARRAAHRACRRP